MLQLGPLSQLAWTSVPHFLDSVHTALLGREKLGRAVLLGPVWKMASSSPQGLIKHQHLDRMGGSCGAVARPACFLRVQLKPQAVPMNVT